jgi:ABC-type nitrate/sulfonate/bicarbonate transport system ATPase subunit
MRQRAALLRTALAHKPLLLLDEPLGALDSLTRMELQDWLERLWLEGAGLGSAAAGSAAAVGAAPLGAAAAGSAGSAGSMTAAPARAASTAAAAAPAVPDRPSVLLVTHDVAEAVRLADRVAVLSPRPARVVATIDVPAPRPRPATFRTSAAAVALQAQLLQALEAGARG